MVTLDHLFKSYNRKIKNLDEPDDLPTDTLLVLSTRDVFNKFTLTPEEQTRLDQLDDELIAHLDLFRECLPFPSPHPRENWWWFLDEGPQVRDAVKQTAA